ncbi:KIN14U, partial [Symbiodinium pilosum]
MQIEVIFLNGQAASVSVDEGASVGDLKRRAQDELRRGIAHFIHTDGTLLDDSATLADVGLSDGDTVTATFGRANIVQASASAFTSLQSDGTVRTWGDFSYGRSHGTLKGVQQIAASASAFAAIRVDGTVVAWGHPFGGGSLPPRAQQQLLNVFQTTGTQAPMDNPDDEDYWPEEQACLGFGEGPTYLDLQAEDRNKVSVSNTNGAPTSFFFDQAFEASATQEEVCDYVSEQVLPHAINGEHICILAYGQTGSGKTYTMFGDFAPGPSPRDNAGANQNQGVAFRAMSKLAEMMRSKGLDASSAPTVELSFLEVYNDNLYDLLDGSRQ